MIKLKDLKSILGHDTLRVAEFFKGYGSQSMSLDAIGVPNKVVVCSEIDPDEKLKLEYMKVNNGYKENDLEKNEYKLNYLGDK